jgi:uncharacterized protein (DUF1330 family)
MPAYVIVEIEVTDPVGYEAYKKHAAATITAQGGRYIVRGGKTEVLEGDWQPKRLVVLEFPSMDRAKTPRRAVEKKRCCPPPVRWRAGSIATLACPNRAA